MRKKVSYLFIVLAFVFSINIFSFNKKQAFAIETIENYQTKSKACCLIDPVSKQVLLSKNEDERLPIASMCKVMTLLICFDALDNGYFTLDDEIVVSENASGMGGSQIFLETNGCYKIRELIKGIVVASANDACVAMAEKISGSEEGFVQKMNEKVCSLGLNNTNFVNCTGLPKPGHYSSAKDVAIMFSELLNHKEYFEFSKIWMDKIAHPNDRITEISNTNKLIKFYKGCDGGKTGYTSEAGHCLTASAIRNNMRLVAVVICAPDSKTRFNEISNMFNYGFANYENKTILDINNPIDLKVEVLGGKKENLNVIPEENVNIFSKKGENYSIEMNFVPINKVKAPIYKGDVVGNLSIFKDGVEIKFVNVLANENIAQKTYFDNLNDILDNWSII